MTFIPSNELEQKFQSLFSELTARLTFCFNTSWPASLQSTDVGKFILILNTLCAAVAPTIINNPLQFHTSSM